MCGDWYNLIDPNGYDNEGNIKDKFSISPSGPNKLFINPKGKEAYEVEFFPSSASLKNNIDGTQGLLVGDGLIRWKSKQNLNRDNEVPEELWLKNVSG